MRLNLYSAAACSFLAYGIEAMSLLGSSTGLDSLENATADPDSTMLSQTSYMDEYEYDLAQTYSDLHVKDDKKEDEDKNDKHKDHAEITKCAKIEKGKPDIKLSVPEEKK